MKIADYALVAAMVIAGGAWTLPGVNIDVKKHVSRQQCSQ
jgi:hypothetical protein